MDRKRCRSSNFTKEEEFLLLSEVEKLKQIIENKQTDKVHTSEKNEAWNFITTKFNANNSVVRSQEQLRNKYENLKMKARKFTADPKYSKGNGGGLPTKTDDPVVDAVIRIINFKTVVGLVNPFDLDSIRNLKSQNQENNLLEAGSNSPTVKLEDIDNPNTEEARVDITEEEPIVLQEQGYASTSTSSTSCIKSNKYTPRTLKIPLSKKLRQRQTLAGSPVKEEYYRKKMKYFEEETKKTIAQQEEMFNKKNQEEEIYKRRITLLDLEIKLKQRELFNLMKAKTD